MSFSFNASGNPREVVAVVGKECANREEVPSGFTDAVIGELGRLPLGAECTLVCYGHTGWLEGQKTGEISLHATLNVRVEQPPAPVERIVDEGPEVVQPGAERFPEDFAGDAEPGPGAGEAERA